MNNHINLATRDGIRTAELFATFNSTIAGETFTFAIHRHLGCGQHVKISEWNTGMGVAEMPFPGLAAAESPTVERTGLTEQGQHAVLQLIGTCGEEVVAQILAKNRLAAQVLNERGQLH